MSPERQERYLLEARQELRALKRSVQAIGDALVEAQVVLRKLDPTFQR